MQHLPEYQRFVSAKNRAAKSLLLPEAVADTPQNSYWLGATSHNRQQLDSRFFVLVTQKHGQTPASFAYFRRAESVHFGR